MRIFIAIELPEEIKKKIDGFQKEISGRVLLRMVAPKNLHLTLVFLGEILETDKEKVIGTVRKGVMGIIPFGLFLGKPEFFPKWGKPRGLWINVEGQTEELGKLQHSLVCKLKESQFILERLDFSAHVTVGRTKGENKRVEFAPFRKAEFTTCSVTIFSSKLTPKGPRYSKIETIPLK